MRSTSNRTDYRELTSLTHIDGRNQEQLTELTPIFSEYAWMKSRLSVMVRYSIYAAPYFEKRNTQKDQGLASTLVNSFTLEEALKVKQYEQVTRHDIKALELYLSDKLKHVSKGLLPYVDIGVGSEDINSIALALQMKEARDSVLIPLLRTISTTLSEVAGAESDTWMVARTHAIPANVTTLGKEIANFLMRLSESALGLKKHAFVAKFSGEVGTLQTFCALPQIKDGLAFTDDFVRSFGLVPVHSATQVAPYDNLLSFLHQVIEINTILLDFVRNIWLYVLLGYVEIVPKNKEVGSAGMPHKVNPIYFEGAEGSLTLASGILETLVRTLSGNRLQRDFSDSTIRRNIVYPIALCVLAYKSIITGLDRIAVNHEGIQKDVISHGEIWLEMIKTYARMHGVPDAYERLYQLTRGKVLDKEGLSDVMKSLGLSKEDSGMLLDRINHPKNPSILPLIREAQALSKKI